MRSADLHRIVSRVGQTNSTAMHGKAGPGSDSRSSPLSSGNCLPRQAHREDSLLFVRSHLDRAAVSCGDLPGNVQSETEAAILRCAGLRSALESMLAAAGSKVTANASH